jgi:hypothetical protein
MTQDKTGKQLKFCKLKNNENTTFFNNNICEMKSNRHATLFYYNTTWAKFPSIRTSEIDKLFLICGGWFYQIKSYESTFNLIYLYLWTPHVWLT